MNSRKKFNLYFNNLLAGRIKECFLTDGTWHGQFEINSSFRDDDNFNRVLEFIRFCINWNSRVALYPDNPPSADEFNDYADLVVDGKWHVTSNDTGMIIINEAPMFTTEEITWRC